VIGRLLAAVSGHVAAADALVKTDDTLSLAISPEGETRVGRSRTETAYLRVLRDGRVGYSSGSGGDAEIPELVGRAMTSAAAGEELDLFLPVPAPIPEVSTRSPQAAAADAGELDGLARMLLERLQRGNRRVEAWAERSIGLVRVGNSRGVLVGYPVSMAGVGAVVESIGVGSAPPCRVFTSGSDLPTLNELERLVAEVDRRLGPPIAELSSGRAARLPVCLAPRAVSAFLRPLRAALTGHQALLGDSPLRGKLGEQAFDARLTVIDDPLAPGRPGSRPIDDEGVVSRRIPLIDRGRVAGFLADLGVGARAMVPSTGHGWRTPNAPPRVGMTNFRVLPGPENLATLLTMMGTGVMIDELDWGAGPNPNSGSIALRAPWAYLVEGGAIRGRLEGVVLSGNVFDALKELGAVGSDATWIGASCLPSLLLTDMSVSRET
jgi:predicted Zn-dependent protease